MAVVVEGMAGTVWGELVPFSAVLGRIVLNDMDAEGDDAVCSLVAELSISGGSVTEEVEKTGSGVTKEV